MKKVLSLLIALCLALALCVPAFAANEGEERVVIGADLSESQILTVYGQFGLTRGSVRELTVTNAEERDYLEGVVSESIIGTRSISCIYIKILPEKAGLNVKTTNITWCSEDMYRAALMTAGIYDAEVQVGAPFGVSGTAALTGVYKAYEDITGTHLDEEAKAAAADELVVTAELSDTITEAIVTGDVDNEALIAAVESGDADEIIEEISNADAVAIVSELKLILDETAQMSDEELRQTIIDIAAEYGYTLDDATIDKLIELVRSMEGLPVSELTERVEQLQSTVQQIHETFSTVQHYAEEVAGFGQKVGQFFESVGQFFRNLFS